MFPFRLFPTNFSICIIPPLGMLWHSPFPPPLTRSSEIQAISGKHFNSVGPLALSFPVCLQLKKDKEVGWGAGGRGAMGSGLGAAGPPPRAAPGGNQRAELQIHSKHSFSLPILVQQPRWFCLDQNQQVAPPPIPAPGWGCLRGRGGEGFSWDDTELGGGCGGSGRPCCMGIHGRPLS